MRVHVLRSTLTLLLLSPLAAPCLAAPITYADAVLEDDPIAYWRFAESFGAATAVDETGDHDGSYSASGITLGESGIGGGDTAALFDGESGRVTVPDDPELGPDLISIEALVRWDGSNGLQQRIVEKSFFTGGEQASYNLVILEDGTIRVEVRSGGSATVHTTSEALSPGDEAHLVGVFDGTSVSIYLDSLLLLTSAASAGSLQDGVNPLGIGNQSERDRPFLGLIDELSLYDYALSGDRIGAHFAALTAVPVPEPPAVWLLAAGLMLLQLLARGRD